MADESHPLWSVTTISSHKASRILGKASEYRQRRREQAYARASKTLERVKRIKAVDHEAKSRGRAAPVPPREAQLSSEQMLNFDSKTNYPLKTPYALTTQVSVTSCCSGERNMTSGLSTSQPFPLHGLPISVVRMGESDFGSTGEQQRRSVVGRRVKAKSAARRRKAPASAANAAAPGWPPAAPPTRGTQHYQHKHHQSPRRPHTAGIPGGYRSSDGTNPGFGDSGTQNSQRPMTRGAGDRGALRGSRRPPSRHAGEPSRILRAQTEVGFAFGKRILQNAASVEGGSKRTEVETIIARLLDGAITDEELFKLLEGMDVNQRFKLMKRVIGLVRQVHTLLDATRLIAKDVHDIDGCVEKITALACQNVGAEKANLRRLDQTSLLEGRGGYIEKKGGFESTTEEAVWRATWDDGKVFVDHVVETKETVNCIDPINDPRFAPTLTAQQKRRQAAQHMIEEMNLLRMARQTSTSLASSTGSGAPSPATAAYRTLAQRQRTISEELAELNDFAVERDVPIPKSVLCTPIQNTTGACIAVLQVMDKISGTHFTRGDEAVIENLAGLAGLILRAKGNDAQSQTDVDDDVYSTMRMATMAVANITPLQRSLRTLDLLEEVSERVRAVVKSDVVRVFVFDKDRKVIWTLKEEGKNDPRLAMLNGGVYGVNLPAERRSKGQGAAARQSRKIEFSAKRSLPGEVLKSKSMTALYIRPNAWSSTEEKEKMTSRAEQLEAFENDIRKASHGNATLMHEGGVQSAICVPFFDDDGEPIGAVLCINKDDNAGARRGAHSEVGIRIGLDVEEALSNRSRNASRRVETAIETSNWNASVERFGEYSRFDAICLQEMMIHVGPAVGRTLRFRGTCLAFQKMQESVKLRLHDQVRATEREHNLCEATRALQDRLTLAIGSSSAKPGEGKADVARTIVREAVHNLDGNYGILYRIDETSNEERVAVVAATGGIRSISSKVAAIDSGIVGTVMQEGIPVLLRCADDMAEVEALVSGEGCGDKGQGDSRDGDGQATEKGTGSGQRKAVSTGTNMASIKADVKETMRRETAKEESRILRALDVDVIKLEDYVRNARETRDREVRHEAEDKSRAPTSSNNKSEVPDGDVGWYESGKVLSNNKRSWDYASLIRSVLFVPLVETRVGGGNGNGTGGAGNQEEPAQTVVGCVVIVQHKQQESHQQRFGHQEAKWLCNFCDIASRSLQQVYEVDALRFQLAEARAREAKLISRLTEVSNHAQSLALHGVHRSMTGCLLEQARVVLNADASAVFVTSSQRDAVLLGERVEDVYAKTAGWVVKAAHEEESDAANESAAEGSGGELFDLATPEASDAGSNDGDSEIKDGKKKVTWRHICTSRDIPDEGYDIEDEVLLGDEEAEAKRQMVVPITIVGDSDRVIHDDSHKTAEDREAEAYLAGDLDEDEDGGAAVKEDDTHKPMKLDTGLAMQVYKKGKAHFEERAEGLVGMLPLRDAANQIFGVMQVVQNSENKNEKKEKSGVVSLLASEPVKQLAVATAQVVGSDVLNTQLFEEVEAELKKARSLLGSVWASLTELRLEPLLRSVANEACKLLSADRCSVFLLDEEQGELWTKVALGLADDGSEEIRISLDEGLAGWVALRGKMANVKNAYEDVRFNPSFDAQVGYKTRSILAAPLHNKTGKCMGVVQMINKVGPGGTVVEQTFSDADEDLLRFYVAIMAHSIYHSKMFEDELASKLKAEEDLQVERSNFARRSSMQEEMLVSLQEELTRQLTTGGGGDNMEEREY